MIWQGVWMGLKCFAVSCVLWSVLKVSLLWADNGDQGLSDLCLAAEGVGSLLMQKRHMIVLEASQTALYGTYFFGVDYRGDDVLERDIPLLYPRNVESIQGLEGVGKEAIFFKNKRFVVSGKFFPKVTVMAVQFRVKLSGMSEQLFYFDMPCSIDHLAILSHKSSQVDIFVEGFKPGIPEMLAGGEMVGLMNTQPLRGGKVLVVEVSSLPEGRIRYTILAWSVALLLVMLSGALLVFKKPDVNMM